MSKAKLSIYVQGATHFLTWELPYFRRYFDVVDSPDENSILFVFGPDALASGAFLPAKTRIALLFPGFGYSPYYDLVHRYGMRKIIDENYDLIFVNPGPIHEAFKDSPKLRLCPFSVDVNVIDVKRYRNKIDTLLHASAIAPQKDWTRSYEVMKLSGLKYEVFPKRVKSIPERLLLKIRMHIEKKGSIRSTPFFQSGYETHKRVIEKYHKYDGFVHVAAETPPYVDGKYTATLLEAGLTGSILFWHDTLGLGNDFETIFNLPLDPSEAAKQILDIRKSINVEAHSRRTAEEIYERVNPDNVMKIRFEAMRELLA